MPHIHQIDAGLVHLAALVEDYDPTAARWLANHEQGTPSRKWWTTRTRPQLARALDPVRPCADLRPGDTLEGELAAALGYLDRFIL